MIYHAYEMARWATRPMTGMLAAGQMVARHPLNPLRDTLLHRSFAALCEVPYRQLREYPKQAYDVREGDKEGVLEEQIVQKLPFADLIRFKTENADERPKVLIAAALSGHHATLLRDTVRGFARDFDPYITDWKDAKAVPLADGDFGLDDYIEYLVQFMETLGPGTHMVATCQAAPPAMVAAAILAKRNPACVPASLTLMAGPVDIRVNPNFIGKMTDKLPQKMFRALNVNTIPPGNPGSGRRVYPGFYQLTSFMAMNLKSHASRYGGFAKDIAAGNSDEAEAFREFYDEYFAVLDMTESFYVETLKRIFFEHHIPKGEMTFRGEPVDFGLVRDMPLLTVEGAKDDMCTLGQTHAAHDVFTGLSDDLRAHHVQEGVGHYGVFSGSKFQTEIYPVIRDFIGKERHATH